jgi:manganese transport protein
VLLLGDRSSNQLLVLSQVVLSLQLPFAVIPLVLFCSRKELMGDLATPRWLQVVAWVIAGLIVAINLGLLLSVAGGFSPSAG